jgi:hypothetical protein
MNNNINKVSLVTQGAKSNNNAGFQLKKSHKVDINGCIFTKFSPLWSRNKKNALA